MKIDSINFAKNIVKNLQNAYNYRKKQSNFVDCFFFLILSHKNIINSDKGGGILTEKSTFSERLTLLCYSNVGLNALGCFYRIFLSRIAVAEGLGVYRVVCSAYI